MAYDIGINCRDTAGFVTDGANETYTKALDVYPVTRGGVTFGADENLSSADRDAGVDRRLAGIVFRANSANFRIDLPEAGSAIVHLAFGDQSSDHANPNQVDVKDDTTPLFTIGPHAITTAKFWDASDVERTTAAWPGSEVGRSVTFATTICRLAFGVPVNFWTLAHVRVVSGAAARRFLLVRR